jgi:2-oxoglutarate ferredoxin oxidoreductase subunit delta
MKRGKVTIDTERCKGCYLCVRACPFKVLEASTAMHTSGVYTASFAHPEKCTACASCYQMCPDSAITVYELEEGETI